MTVKELVEKLSQLDQDLDVMFVDPNSHGGPFLVDGIQVETADEDEFPEDWNMPAGYQFVLL